MKPDQTQDDSQPFLLRVWKEEVEGGFVWTGRLQHILTGNGHLFHDWSGLIELLEADLHRADGGRQTGVEDLESRPGAGFGSEATSNNSQSGEAN